MGNSPVLSGGQPKEESTRKTVIYAQTGAEIKFPGCCYFGPGAAASPPSGRRGLQTSPETRIGAMKEMHGSRKRLDAGGSALRGGREQLYSRCPASRRVPFLSSLVSGRFVRRRGAQPCAGLPLAGTAQALCSALLQGLGCVCLPAHPWAIRAGQSPGAPRLDLLLCRTRISSSAKLILGFSGTFRNQRAWTHTKLGSIWGLGFQNCHQGGRYPTRKNG